MSSSSRTEATVHATNPRWQPLMAPREGYVPAGTTTRRTSSPVAAFVAAPPVGPPTAA